MAKPRVPFGVESNWRWNVWWAGQWQSDWELCARALEAPFDDWYLVKRSVLPPQAWVYAIRPNEVPVFVGSYELVPGDGNFPWGNLVEPD